MSAPGVPFVSVGVPTRNRADLLEGCLAGLTRQDYPSNRYEVIVVDDGSRDATPRVVEAARRPGGPAVRLLAQPHRGANAARNHALRAAVGDPVCFVDDDIDVPPEWLGRLAAAAVRHPVAGCLGGPIRASLDGVPARHRAREPLGEEGFDLGGESREVRYVWSGNFAIRRHAVEKIGPLQEHRLLGHDEVEWIDRLHHARVPVVYVADAPVWHRRRPGDLALHRAVRQRFVRGIGESVAYHRVGVAYRTRAQVQGLRDELHLVAREWRGDRLPAAAQFAGRLAGWAPLRAWDRIRGRSGPLAPPPG